MSLSSTACNALALSQETSDNFVHRQKVVIFNNWRERAPGLSPALGFCFMKHMGQCYSVHFTAKTFLCRSAGYQLLLAGHLLRYEYKLSPLIRVPRHDTGCLLIAKFCHDAVI